MASAIDTGEILEALNDKVDRDNRNVDLSVTADAIIEYQLPSSANGYTWYRLYASGWVEQGAYIPGEGDSLLKTISLPITMADSNYTVVSTPVTTSTASPSNDKYPSVQQLSTTSFKLYLWSSISKTWQVSGMSAS